MFCIVLNSSVSVDCFNKDYHHHP